MTDIDWTDPNTPTLSVDEFLALELLIPNIWWQIGSGHHRNLFDLAVAERNELREKVRRLEAGDDVDAGKLPLPGTVSAKWLVRLLKIEDAATKFILWHDDTQDMMGPERMDEAYEELKKAINDDRA